MLMNGYGVSGNLPVTMGSHIMQNSSFFFSEKQRGIALIATLLVVVIVAMIGTSVIHRTLTAKKNFNSLQDMEAAYYAAESAIRTGAADARQATSAGSYPKYTTDKWWNDWSTVPSDSLLSLTDFKKSTSGGPDFLKADPQYMVEEIRRQPFNAQSTTTQAQVLYRISARATGRQEGLSMLQSIYSYNKG